jgi:hypothetical protein
VGLAVVVGDPDPGVDPLDPVDEQDDVGRRDRRRRLDRVPGRRRQLDRGLDLGAALGLRAIGLERGAVRGIPGVDVEPHDPALST